MTNLSTDTTLAVPKEIAVCPYCKTALTISFDSWSKNDDETWSATNCSMDCEAEPEIGSDEWEGWFDSHSDMPYVYLMPVQEKVLRWVNANYRFDIKDAVNV